MPSKFNLPGRMSKTGNPQGERNFFHSGKYDIGIRPDRTAEIERGIPRSDPRIGCAPCKGYTAFPAGIRHGFLIKRSGNGPHQTRWNTPCCVRRAQAHSNSIRRSSVRAHPPVRSQSRRRPYHPPRWNSEWQPDSSWCRHHSTASGKYHDRHPAHWSSLQSARPPPSSPAHPQPAAA